MADEKSSERILTVPLRKEWLKSSRTSRTKRSVKAARSFIERHMKSDQVKLSEKVNQKIWAGGIHKPPGKIRVKAVVDKEGVVKVMLPDEKPRKEEPKKGEKKEKPKEEPKAPAEKPEARKEDKPKAEKPKEK